MIDREAAIFNRGNCSRLKNVLQRAAAKEALTIGFIGGSITQGSLSSLPTTCYAYQIFKWWEDTFPNTAFTYVNAGIGGTTSQFGVARVEADLLSKKPDFVIIEFSVNDESDEHFLETYEGLVRKVYYSSEKPAVMLLHNVYYHTGGNAQLQHGKIGRYYQLPCISMQSSIYPQVVSGQILNREITPDDLHPNDKGHALVASMVTYFLEKINKVKENEEEVEEQQKVPMTYNDYENVVRYQNKNILWQGEGFDVDQSEQKDITDCFKHGWTAREKGAHITFVVEASSLAIQYRRSVKQPAPIASVVIDGKTDKAVLLDGNFDETWGDKLELTTVLEHGERKKHTVQITIVEGEEMNKKMEVPFYLVSVIG